MDPWSGCWKGNLIREHHHQVSLINPNSEYGDAIYHTIRENKDSTNSSPFNSIRLEPEERNINDDMKLYIRDDP